MHQKSSYVHQKLSDEHQKASDEDYIGNGIVTRSSRVLVLSLMETIQIESILVCFYMFDLPNWRQLNTRLDFINKHSEFCTYTVVEQDR